MQSKAPTMHAVAVLMLLTTASFFLQTESPICIKMGGSYFINCARTIVFGDQDIMTMEGDDIKGRKIHFDLFSAKGKLEATLQGGVFSGSNAHQYAVKALEDGFMIFDKRSDRVVLVTKNVNNAADDRKEVHIWADFYLPDGNRFQCTPDESNVPVLNMLRGATFTNSEIAISL
jgi:hypothetical protein